MQKLTKLLIPEQVARKQYLVDANGKILGRLAQEVAKTLRGKGKPFFSYHRDIGDQVVVFNAEKIRVTGKKQEVMSFTRYSGYPGGLKKITLEKLLKERPEQVIQHAVRGMLPKSPLGRKLFRKLKVYKGETLPFGTKQFKVLDIPS